MTSNIKVAFEFMKSILAEADIDILLPVIMDLVIQETNAERCQVLLYSDSGEILFNRGRKKGDV